MINRNNVTYSSHKHWWILFEALITLANSGNLNLERVGQNEVSILKKLLSLIHEFLTLTYLIRGVNALAGVTVLKIIKNWCKAYCLKNIAISIEKLPFVRGWDYSTVFTFVFGLWDFCLRFYLACGARTTTTKPPTAALSSTTTTKPSTTGSQPTMINYQFLNRYSNAKRTTALAYPRALTYEPWL